MSAKCQHRLDEQNSEDGCSQAVSQPRRILTYRRPPPGNRQSLVPQLSPVILGQQILHVQPTDIIAPQASVSTNPPLADHQEPRMLVSGPNELGQGASVQNHQGPRSSGNVDIRDSFAAHRTTTDYRAFNFENERSNVHDHLPEAGGIRTESHGRYNRPASISDTVRTQRGSPENLGVDLAQGDIYLQLRDLGFSHMGTVSFAGPSQSHGRLACGHSCSFNQQNATSGEIRPSFMNTEAPEDYLYPIFNSSQEEVIFGCTPLRHTTDTPTSNDLQANEGHQSAEAFLRDQGQVNAFPNIFSSVDANGYNFRQVGVMFGDTSSTKHDNNTSSLDADLSNESRAVPGLDYFAEFTQDADYITSLDLGSNTTSGQRI